MAKNISKGIIETSIRFIRSFSLMLNNKQRQKIGAFIGSISRILMRSRYVLTVENICQAFPDKTREWAEQTAKKSFRNIGITFFETLTIDSYNEENIHSFFKFHNIELYHSILSRGQGALLMSAHLSNWEILAYSAKLIAKHSLLIVVKQQKYGDELINGIRTSCGNEIVEMGAAARKMFQWVRAGKPVALLVDQSATANKDIFVDFFGKPAATYKAPAELALKLNLPVIVSFAVRETDGTYSAHIKELEIGDLEANLDGAKELMRRYNAELEVAIRNNPEQWAWQHKRWKHEPPAETIK